MASVDTSLTSTFGSAVVLLQANLGVGLLLGALGVAVSSSHEVRSQLEGKPWEATLRSAAKAVSPAPLLIAYALVQVRAAPADMLASTGLLVSGASVFLSTFLAILGPVLGARFATASRVLHVIRAFGQMLMVFGRMPAGVELFCASLFIRAALAARSASAVSCALSLGSDASEDVEQVVAMAPLIGAIALLDNMAWGPSGVMAVPFQASLLCTVLLGLVVAVRFGMGGSVTSAGRHAMDVQFEDGLFEGIRSKLVALIFVVLAFSVCRVFVGTFGIQVSTSSISIAWGDLLTASAAKVALLIVGTYIVSFVPAGPLDEAEEETDGIPPINGMEVANGVSKTHGKGLGMLDYMKAIVAPAEVLVLALIAAQMGSQQETSLGALPFKYGFILAALGVGLQIVSLLAFATANAGKKGAEPCFDTTGTIQWAAEDGTLMFGLRSLTLLCLECGLLLGCLGLGATPMVVGFVTSTGALFVLSPAETRQTGIKVATLIWGSFTGGVEAIIEQQRAAQEAAAARRAAAVARTLEAEAEKGEKVGKAVSKQASTVTKRKGK